MKTLSLICIVIFISVLSCDIPSSKSQDSSDSEIIDSLENEVQLLKESQDSLKAELAYVAQLNENIYQEREAVKRELNALKKKYNIRASDGSNPLAKYNLELTRSKTGYRFSNLDRLFLPAITLEFKNRSSNDLNQRVYLKYIFVNKKTGEQIHESSKTFCDSYSPLAGGLIKQITQRSEVGWSVLRDQEIAVRVYIRDVFWREFKIENTQYIGRI